MPLPDPLPWLPPVGEALGEERAHLLVRWLREHGPSAVEDARRALRARHPGCEVEVSMCSVRWLAPQVRHEYSVGLYAGNVFTSAGGTLAQIGVRARFDGTCDWYWVLGE